MVAAICAVWCMAAQFECLARPPVAHEPDSDASEAQTTRPRPACDFRELERTLKGASITQVFETLGKPKGVFISGPSESWEYADVAFDPVSQRNVHRLVIWFRDGREDYMTASY